MSYVGHSEGTTQMFLAGALMPEYFTPKINLAIMLAPVARTSNLKGAPHIAAQHIEAITLTLVDTLHIYDVVSPHPAASEGLDVICKVPLLTDLCKWIADIVIDPELMNTDRFEMAATNLPSGAGWRTIVYYGQMIVSGEYNLYDYGKKKNMEVYGQEDPKKVPIEDYNIPTAMMSGDRDQLAVPIDVEWTVAQLGDNVVFNKQYHANHGSFCLANDMSFFSVDAINLLAKYNPVTAPKFDDVIETFLS